MDSLFDTFIRIYVIYEVMNVSTESTVAYSELTNTHSEYLAMYSQPSYGKKEV